VPAVAVPAIAERVRFRQRREQMALFVAEAVHDQSKNSVALNCGTGPAKPGGRPENGFSFCVRSRSTTWAGKQEKLHPRASAADPQDTGEAHRAIAFGNSVNYCSPKVAKSTARSSPGALTGFLQRWIQSRSCKRCDSTHKPSSAKSSKIVHWFSLHRLATGARSSICD
jgi:hypothetical protein